MSITTATTADTSSQQTLPEMKDMPPCPDWMTIMYWHMADEEMARQNTINSYDSKVAEFVESIAEKRKPIEIYDQLGCILDIIKTYMCESDTRKSKKKLIRDIRRKGHDENKSWIIAFINEEIPTTVKTSKSELNDLVSNDLRESDLIY